MNLRLEKENRKLKIQDHFEKKVIVFPYKQIAKNNIYYLYFDVILDSYKSQ